MIRSGEREGREGGEKEDEIKRKGEGERERDVSKKRARGMK